MSAQELLDLLEQDVNNISQIEERKLRGIETLLEAMATLKQKPVEDRLDRLVAHTLKFHAPQSLPVKPLQVASMAIEEKAASLAKTALPVTTTRGRNCSARSGMRSDHNRPAGSSTTIAHRT